MSITTMVALADIDLVLASTSRYRSELLARLTSTFRVLAPEVEECAPDDELPAATAARLATAKAHAVAAMCPHALIIGSDQVAEIDGRRLGKPVSVEAAHTQLAASSARSVAFHTAICLLDTRGLELRDYHAIDTTHAVFRALDTAEIARYVALEKALDCAGSFKAEGLGIALFERIDSSDPSALIGLPLIALARLLRAAGVAVP